MKFRTTIRIPSPDIRLTYDSRLFLLGSCFSDNIGGKLSQHKFDSISNPFGVLYNPISVLNHLQKLGEENPEFQPDLQERRGLWFDYRFHSTFSHIRPETAERKMQYAFRLAERHFKKTDVLFITWGTAFVYMLKENQQVVANCHKQPGSVFDRKKLSTEEICRPYTDFFQMLESKYPDMSVVLTISPVRHLKDGFVDNQRSKASLILAAELLERKFRQVSYFPAYEIMMDDLRDYRFYGKDLCHPSAEAVEYLWKCFSESYFTSDIRKLKHETGQITAAANHRLMFPESEEAQRFALAQLKKIENVMPYLPAGKLDVERDYFKSLLK